MISAIVLAAGKSTRMGRQKLLMPWGDTTVIGKVLQTLQNAGVEDIVIVTNAEVAGSISDPRFPLVLNNDGDMLASIQLGLGALLPPPSIQDTSPKFDGGSVEFGGGREGALVCLGDQPQVGEGSVRSVCEAFRKSKSNLVVPSYRMRRGHPWLAARARWGEILALREGQSMRGFLNAHAHEIEYVNVDTPGILQDLDTPEDYLKYKPSL